MTEHKRAAAKRSDLNRLYPYQVALPDSFCSHENYKVIEAFCQQFMPPPKTRNIVVAWTADHRMQDLRIYCFASEADADSFASHFDGERCDVRTIKGVWQREGAPQERERHGPLWLPRFFAEHK